MIASPWGLIGFLLILAAMRSMMRIEANYPSIDLRELFNTIAMFWVGFLLLTWRAVTANALFR